MRCFLFALATFFASSRVNAQVAPRTTSSRAHDAEISKPKQDVLDFMPCSERKEMFRPHHSGFCQSTQKYFHEDTKAMTDVTAKVLRTEDRHTQLARVLPRDYPKILRTTAFLMSRFPWTANSSQLDALSSFGLRGHSFPTRESV